MYKGMNRPLDRAIHTLTLARSWRDNVTGIAKIGYPLTAAGWP